jgi:UDPglucose 6-dehydrogenase
VKYAVDEYDAVKDADALIIATEWSLFRTPDHQRLTKLLKQKVIFDGRNLYDLQEMRDQGFHYVSIGRSVVNGSELERT